MARIRFPIEVAHATDKLPSRFEVWLRGWRYLIVASREPKQQNPVTIRCAPFTRIGGGARRPRRPQAGPSCAGQSGV